MKKRRVKSKLRLSISIIVFILAIVAIVFFVKNIGARDVGKNPGETDPNATGSAVVDPQPSDEPTYPAAEGILILANKTHSLSKDYWPEDLVTVDRFVSGVGNDNTHKLRAEAAEALNKMFDAALNEGLEIRLRTGFRSYDYQSTLYQSYVDKNGKEAADTFSARPGYSEHQTGLACDLGGKTEKFALSYDFGKTDEGKWVANHAHEFGFIIRYTDEEITGYVFEPWHVRYVGVENATKIYEEGITLEEYLGLVDSAQYKD